MVKELDYTYYAEEFGGSIIPEDRFNYVMQRAEMHLHMFTLDRLKGKTYDSIVKNCLCDMAETIYKVEKQNAKGIKKSENTDGYSVSYVTEIADGQDMQEVLSRKLYGIAKCYLMNTGMLCLRVE